MTNPYRIFLEPRSFSINNKAILAEKFNITFKDDTPTFRLHIPKDDSIQFNLFLSGGMDSGTLAFMLMTYGYSPKLYTIVDKAFIPRVEILKNYLKESFPNLKINHEYVERSEDELRRDGHSIRGFTTNFVYSKYPKEVFYEGATQLPTKDVLHEMGELLPNRGAHKSYRAGDLTLLDCDYGFYTPYIGFDKRITAFLANHFNFDISKSWTCTENIQEECGMCFACKEKQWALRSYNILSVDNISQ